MHLSNAAPTYVQAAVRGERFIGLGTRQMSIVIGDWAIFFTAVFGLTWLVLHYKQHVLIKLGWGRFEIDTRKNQSGESAKIKDDH